MDVVFCVDRKGLKQFAVSATSFAIHRPQKTARLFLLSVDVTESDVAKFFQTLKSEYGLSGHLIRVPRSKFDAFPVFGHVTVGTYFRLMIGEVLPDDVSDVLYLDTDIVVHRPLEDLLSEAVQALHSSGHIAAAVVENPKTGEHLRRAGLLEGPYLQAGVMLINVPRWRKAFSLDYFADMLTRNTKNIIWWDQDLLNIALQGKWLQLPQSLNGTPTNRTADTAIYHYAGIQKPWRYRSDYEDPEVYEHYRQQTQVLRPLKTDPASVFRHYTKPFRTAKKVIKKKLRIKSKKPRP